MQAKGQDVRTALEMWNARVAASGDRLAFRFKRGGEWQSITFREADAAARELAAGLAAMGVGAGDTVCIISQSRYEWMLFDLAIVLAGAISVPIYASNTAEQCAFIIKDSGAKLAVAEDAAQLEKLVSLRGQMPWLKLVHIDGDATLEKTDARGRTVIKLADVLATASGPAGVPQSLAALREQGMTWTTAHPDELSRRTSKLGGNDVFTIIYTSGTTGNPKGVVLTHENLASNVASACRALTLRDDDEQLLFLPLAHVLGREVLWAAVHSDAPTAFAEAVTKVKDNLAEIRPTFMAGVPRVFEKFYAGVKAGAKQGPPTRQKLVAWAFDVGARYAAALRRGESPGVGLKLNHAIAEKLVLSKLRKKLGLDRCRFLISGGAPLAAEIAEFFHGAGLLILEGYGLTETVGAAFVNRLERYRFGTVGPALDVVECKIAEDGEILMRGASVFKRYWNNAPATAEGLDSEGWFHSGDIGVLEDGFLRITDRKKDLIVTANGKKVAPQMLENALKMRSKLVSQVMAFGDKRPYCVALVTLNEDAIKQYGGGDPIKAAASADVRAALQADIDAVNANLASFESIKAFAVLPGDFTEASGELTPSMKVKRKVVIDRYARFIEELYGQAAA